MKRLFLCALCMLVLLNSCGGGREEYRIARDPDWYPLDFIGRENNVLAFSDALVTEIAQLEGFRAELFPVGWINLQDDLLKGRTDAVLTSIPPTPYNRQLYDFSDVYLYVGPVLVVAEQTEANSLDDLKGKIVAVRSGSPAMVVAARIPDVVIVDVISIPIALDALAQGEVDGVIMQRLPALAYVRDLYGGVLKVATPPLTDEGLRLLVKKGKNRQLLNEFDRGLKKIMDNGTYDDLQKEWGLFLEYGPQGSI